MVQRTVKALLVGIAALVVSAGAWAQSSPTRMNGLISGPTIGGFIRVTFACVGTPTCAGTYTATEAVDECSNTFTYTDTLVITGVDLSRPGTSQGTITTTSRTRESVTPGTRTCNWSIVPEPMVIPFTATWDGTNGTIVVRPTDSGTGQTFSIPGTFTATLPTTPTVVFPMTVSTNITPTTTSASAMFQPRPQDVGTTASVYVFAHAPASLLDKSLEKADYCVLVQVDSTGKLVAVNSANLQAYTTGVLSAQGQSVSILNGVPTPNVAGASFYVGYGASAAAMFAAGLYQAAFSVPGGSQCNASLTSAPAADTPGGLTGLWWNSGESGWGIHFTQRRNVIFAAWYTYDGAGRPKWYVASSCALPAGNTGTSGTCSGTLYEVSGPTFFGTTFNPGAVSVAAAGSLQVTFQNANAASMTYSLGTGPAPPQVRTVALTRQVFASGTAAPAVDYTDLWWNPSESGWGMAIAHQYGTMFLAWYVYDGTGKPVWYVASNCEMSGSLCLGTLYRTTGPAFGPTFDPSRIQVFTAGTVNVIFIDANNGLLTYTVDGVTSSKTIKRQSF